MITSYFRSAPTAEQAAAAEVRGLVDMRKETATALKAAGAARPADVMLSVVLGDADKRDTLLRRYLRSYTGDSAKAAKAVITMLTWRQRMKLEEIMDPMKYLGGPGIGIPLWISPLRMSGEERVGITYCALEHVPKRFDYKMLERGCGVVFDFLLYARAGVEADDLVSIVDFSGFSISQADLTAMKTSVTSYVQVCILLLFGTYSARAPGLSPLTASLFGMLTAVYQCLPSFALRLQYYPGVFKKIYIVNYPVGIYALWKVISPLLDQNTIDSIVFVKGSLSLREQLAENVPARLVPDFLGGTGKTSETQTSTLELANGVKMAVSEISQRLQ